MKGEQCDCGYEMTELTIPRAGCFQYNTVGYKTIDKSAKKGIGFEFAGYKMCPKCYAEFCNDLEGKKKV